MNVHAVDILFICIVWCSLFLMRDSRMICKQREFGEVRVLLCPPVNHTELANLSYCCSKNGLMACCNYEDYKQKHAGPDLMTSVLVIVCEIGLIVGLVAWCYIHRCRG